MANKKVNLNEMIEGEYKKYTIVNVAKLLNCVVGSIKKEKKENLQEITRQLKTSIYWQTYEDNLTIKALKEIIKNKKKIKLLKNKELVNYDDMIFNTYWIKYRKDAENILYEAIKEENYNNSNIVKINNSEIVGITSKIGSIGQIKGFSHIHKVLYKNKLYGLNYQHYKLEIDRYVKVGG